jgi:hypothetical protein
VLVPLVGGCISVPPPPGGYIQVNQAPAPAPAPAPVTPSGEAEPTPDPVAQDNVPTVPDDANSVSLPEDPALVEDHYADLDFGDFEGGGAQFPPNAKVMNGGHGNLFFKSTERGRVFVFDADARRVLLSARVREGQAIEVRTARGIVTVDGEEQLLQSAMNRRNKHQVLFAEFRGFGWGDRRGGWDRDGRSGYRGNPLRESLERAKVVARGRGTLSHYATTGGVLYVRDLDTGKIVRATAVPGRVRVTLTPSQDLLKASNGKLWPMEMDRTHAHALLWDDKGQDTFAWMLRRNATAGAGND